MERRADKTKSRYSHTLGESLRIVTVSFVSVCYTCWVVVRRTLKVIYWPISYKRVQLLWDFNLSLNPIMCKRVFLCTIVVFVLSQ